MTTVQVQDVSAAQPEQVWAVLTDVRDWPRWSAFDEARVLSGEGVGQVHELRAGKVTGRERVTALEPPRRMAYELLAGLPLRDYRAEVVLEPTGEGTRIRWRADFRSKVPGTGWLAAKQLTPVLQALTTDLARAAESS